MTNEPLRGLKVAILITDGFEQVEMARPRRALEDAGAQALIVSPMAKRVRAWKFGEWGDWFQVDVPLDQAEPEDFDTLLLPGGLVSLDVLRIQPKAMAFAKAFFDADKPVAAICRGPWTITEIHAAQGRRLTSCSSFQADLRNAGADWVDEPVVVDRNLVTSRSPAEIPIFNREMIKLFSAAQERRHAA